MDRFTRRLASLAPALALAAALGGCQDYNFSPVEYCLIQPGTERVTLSDISTADILFVVDDSGSMAGEQQKLASSFAAFVDRLKQSNVDRVASQLEPIDFHIAVTTTSVFLNAPTSATCSAACAGATGQQVCCDSVTSQPLTVPKGCAATAECGAGGTCREDCQGRAGEKTCCAAAGAAPEQAQVACPVLGQPCGRLQNRYVVPRTPRLCTATTSCAVGPDPADPNPAPAGYACRTSCIGLGGTSACCDTAGIPWRDETCIQVGSQEGTLYPRGDFVRAGSNPRVLHFEKPLFCPAPVPPATTCGPVVAGGPEDQQLQALVTQFGENVKVGTCGSGQEQALEAARRAIQKATHQAGASQPADVLPGEWPHPKSKLVVVFVGDEDDCSSPEDPNLGVIFSASGTDACEADGALPADQQRRTKLQVYSDFLYGLDRPVAAAFIVSARAETCEDGTCQADICCDTSCTGDPNVCTVAGVCGGQGAGFRLIEFSKQVRGRGADTVVGSVCNPGTPAKPGFSSILERVAEVVKQPVGLQLPTQPAAAKLTILRIAGADGKTRKTCFGPAPLGLTSAQAEADGYDWWFTGGDDTDRTPTGPSRAIYLNRATHGCEANPGETYSADYLGLVPAEGCDASDPTGQRGRQACVAALGGRESDWTCDASGGGALGTCLCSGSTP